ncbi:pyrolysin [Ceratobasidium sp. AG-Ba]|nr:pyrolysin [Ceratobasidium sp. AG-Ba]
MKVLDEWISAYSKLMEASADFHQTCANIRSAITSVEPFASRANQDVLEKVLSEIRSRVDTLSAVDSQTCDSRVLLNRLLNQSTLRTPINKLPSEVLSRVFSIVATFPSSSRMGYRDSLMDVLIVCSRWHTIATNTPSIWNNIYVRLDDHASRCVSGFNWMRLSLQRSRTTPVTLELHFTSYCKDERVIPEMASILKPHAECLTSLKVSGDWTESWVQAIYDIYSELEIDIPIRNLSIYEFASESQAILTDNHIRGLVELSLCGSSIGAYTCPSLDNLAKTLSNCPELHTLHLKGLYILTEAHYDPVVVQMPNLRVLEIANLVGPGVPQLLSMLQPGTLGLDVRLEFKKDTTEHARIQALLARSNVLSLTFTTNMYHKARSQLPNYLASVPNLRSLLLRDESGPTTKTAKEFCRLLASRSPFYTPHLESLCLIRGDFYPGSIQRWKRVVIGRRLRIIGLLCCRFISRRESYFTGHSDYSEESDEDHDTDGTASNQDSDYEYRITDHSEDTTEACENFRNWLLGRIERVVIADFMTSESFTETVAELEQFRSV